MDVDTNATHNSKGAMDKFELRHEFLKLSEEYEKCCAAGGSGSLAHLYAFFGDVRGLSYLEWRERKMREYGHGPMLPFNCCVVESPEEAADYADAGLPVLVLNPDGDPRKIKRDLCRLVDEYVRKRPTDYEADPDIFSEYPIDRKVNVTALSKQLAVVAHFKKHGKKNLYSAGESLGISPKISKKEDGGKTSKKHKMVSTVGRLHRAGCNVIKKLEAGQFPP